MLLSSSNRKYSPFPLLSYFSVDVCLRCLLHHILSRIAYTFRENWEFVFIIIVQFMMSANSRICFGLQIVFVSLYITPSHYHHCANLSEDSELIKCLSDIFCRVCKIKHILSVIHYTTCGAVCFQFTHCPCDDWENIYTLSYYHHQIGNMNYYPFFRVRSWNNGMRCMSFYILQIIGLSDAPNHHLNQWCVVKKISVNYGAKYNNFHARKWTEKCCLQQSTEKPRFCCTAKPRFCCALLQTTFHVMYSILYVTHLPLHTRWAHAWLQSKSHPPRGHVYDAQNRQIHKWPESKIKRHCLTMMSHERQGINHIYSRHHETFIYDCIT